MQRLVKHRRSMLAVILAVLVALSSTLMMLLTMGRQEEKPALQEEKPALQEEKPALQESTLQDDDQLIASTDTKGRAHFGLGIMNPIEHRIISLTNSKDNKANATFTTSTSNSITNSNDNNNNYNKADVYTNNRNTRRSD
ncbi:MAG: hypothetical protein M3298_00925 [Thermoproteota archaeon]|nr:hypothetical protein [Thermoproteota archaeon]